MIYIAPKKRAIPQQVRRDVAMRAGADGIGQYPARCAYCGKPGVIHWMTRCWVYFRDLELDHLIPESRGGQAVSENIVLACRWCNRSRSFRHALQVRFQ